MEERTPLLRIIERAGLLGGMALLALLAGCAADGSKDPQRAGPSTAPNAIVATADDYDYFPAYETYYHRDRQEYLYHDGRAWIRRPVPAGVTVEALLASPSVRLESLGSPEQEHRNVVLRYPKAWTPPAQPLNEDVVNGPTDAENDLKDRENDIRNQETDRIPHDRRD